MLFLALIIWIAEIILINSTGAILPVSDTYYGCATMGLLHFTDLKIE